MNAIELKDVGEQFRTYPYGRAGLKEHILHAFRRKRGDSRKFWALRGINLTIKKGEVVGIIGENGSGKTTLLKLIAGILTPDEGILNVQGKISALFELGTAFHPELTGRENTFLNGTVLGLSREEVNSRFKDIVEYSELGKFIDFPLKTYSAGMSMRLGFAIAINVAPEILLVDEVFVVGDETFQRRCLRKIVEFKKQGKTIILVSHDMGLVAALCKKVILMREGAIVKEGPADEVISFYIQTVGDKKGVGILKKNRVDLIFNNGHGKLFWQGIELTKELGIFTSLLSNGKWHTSCANAVWECIEKDNTTMVFQGNWKNLPLTQLWKLALEDENTIRWIVEMRINGKVNLEREQIAIMLKDAYGRWSAGDQEGVFPSDFTEELGRWEVIWVQNSYSGSVSTDSVQDDSLHLPSIVFEGASLNRDYMVSIENSDQMFEGRVFQYSAVNPGKKAEFIANDCRYFSGTIKIEDW